MKLLLILLASLVLASCGVQPGQQIVIHPYAELKTPSEEIASRYSTNPNYGGKRQLLLFLDGTGNDVASRTHVRRFFEQAAAQGNPRLLCYYDQGVGTRKLGTSAKKPILGLGFGWGFINNIWEAVGFIAANYREGDDIRIFGFSRGAYTAVALSAVIKHHGIPFIKKEKGESAPKRLARATAISKNQTQKLFRSIRRIGRSSTLNYAGQSGAEVVQAGTAAHLDFIAQVIQEAEASRPSDNEPLDTESLCLWDPVGALYHPFSGAIRRSIRHDPRSEFERHAGDMRTPYFLDSHVKNCYLALSLDEKRQPFTADLPLLKDGWPAKGYKAVWFAGDHSDVGGGHKNKDLAGITYNWMLKQVGQAIFGEKVASRYVYFNENGPRHDLSERGFHFKASSTRVRGECFPPNIKTPVFKRGSHRYDKQPIRSHHWKMRIHRSVINRMKSGYDIFAKEKEDKLFEQAYIPAPFNGEQVTGTYYRSDETFKMFHAPAGWMKEPWDASRIKQSPWFQIEDY